VCYTACERWKHAANVSAENGIFYPLLSAAGCMELCVSTVGCVAVDLWSSVCSMHVHASDLLSNRFTVGVSQYVLDRSCPATTSTSSVETDFTTSMPTTGFETFRETVSQRVLRFGLHINDTNSFTCIFWWYFNVYRKKHVISRVVLLLMLKHH